MARDKKMKAGGAFAFDTLPSASNILNLFSRSDLYGVFCILDDCGCLFFLLLIFFFLFFWCSGDSFLFFSFHSLLLTREKQVKVNSRIETRKQRAHTNSNSSTDLVHTNSTSSLTNSTPTPTNSAPSLSPTAPPEPPPAPSPHKLSPQHSKRSKMSMFFSIPTYSNVLGTTETSSAPLSPQGYLPFCYKKDDTDLIASYVIALNPMRQNEINYFLSAFSNFGIDKV
jgi:hypothetical protein